jgi:hypothetical protein
LIDCTKKHEAKGYWRSMGQLKEFIVMNVENDTSQIFYLHSNEVSHTAIVDECLGQM